MTKKKLTKFAKATKKFQGKKLGQLRNQKNKPRIDPLWTIEDGVTYSLLSQFLNCRNRFHINKVQGWTAKRISLPLEFGNVFHLMAEAQDRGIPDEQLMKIATNYVGRKIEEQSLDTETIKELSMMAAVATVTFEQYVAYWQQNPCFQINNKWYYEKDFQWIGKEENFDVDYLLPNGRKVRLRGKQDGKFQIAKGQKGNWLFETKTKGNIDADGITAGLHKDMQTGLYLTAMALQQHGTLPEGVLYNVIRRTQLKPRVADTPKMFAERVETDIMKRPEFYFMRWTRSIDAGELRDFRDRQLNPTLYQIVRWWDSIKHHPMKPWTTPKKCKACDGKKKTCRICGGDGEVMVSNMEHYERAFGHYDSMAFSQRGDFFEIVAHDNYFNYEQQKYIFPELEEEDELTQYLVGV